MGDQTRFHVRGWRCQYDDHNPGTKISYPAITAPVGNQGSVHAQKDLPNAREPPRLGPIFCANSVAQMSVEDIAPARDGPEWFQVSIPRDRGFAKEMLATLSCRSF